MNKLIAFAVFAAATVLTINAREFESAQDAVKHMGPGINLANSLECHSRFTDLMMIEKCSRAIPTTKYERHGGWDTDRMPYLTTFAKGEGKGNIPTIEDYETAWEQPLTTRALIHMWKEAGFNAVRVPVTWYPHMDYDQYIASISDNASTPDLYNNPTKADNNISFMDFYGIHGNGGTWDRAAWLAATSGTSFNRIDSDWLARVKEVVDWVIEEGMYCIINVHHDTGASQHAAPQGTTNVGGNSRWINANYAWWPDPATQSSAPQKTMEDGSTTHGDVYKIVTTGEGTTAADPCFEMTFDYGGGWDWVYFTFEIYALENCTLNVEVVDLDGNNPPYNNAPEAVKVEKNKWKRYYFHNGWGQDGGTYKLRVFMNTPQDGQTLPNTYYIDKSKIVKNLNDNTPYITSSVALTGNGGSMTTVTFADEGLSTEPDPDPNVNGVYAKAKFTAIWEQVADYFGDYGDHLLFEGYNEVLDGGANEGDNDWDHKSEQGRNVTSDMAKTFVNTVRASASAHPNNGIRNLIIPTYYASDVPITVPTDNTTDNKGHLITEVHCYPNVGSYIGYNNPNTKPADALNYVNDHFVEQKDGKNRPGSMHLPMILGEWGSTDIFTYDVFRDGTQDGKDNRDDVKTFSKNLYQSLKENNRAGFIWRSLCDEGYRGYTDAGGNWVAPQWNPQYVEIKNAIMQGFYGNDGYQGHDYGVYPNLYTIYNSSNNADKDGGYLSVNRVINNGSQSVASLVSITDAKPYRPYYTDADNNCVNQPDIIADKLVFTRTYTHNQWFPLYVPFDIKPSDFASVAEFAVFDKIEQGLVDDVLTVVVTVDKIDSNHSDWSSYVIPANTPCVMKLKNATTPLTYDLVVNNATLKGATADVNTTTCESTTTSYTCSIEGTYEDMTGDDLDGKYAMTQGKFRPCKTDGTDVLRPNRIYLSITSTNGAPAPQKVSIAVSSNDEELNSIADAVIAPMDNVYYDLMGRPVANPTHGFYIRNGQKVIIR